MLSCKLAFVRYRREETVRSTVCTAKNLAPSVPLRQAIGHKAEDLAGGFFDWLLAADNQVGKLASRQNEFFTSWTHIGVVLHEHKVQVVATLSHVPRLTPLKANRIGRSYKSPKIKYAAHLRPVKGKQPFHDKEVARANLVKAILHSRMRGEIENGPLDGLTAAQRQEMLSQKPVLYTFRTIKVEFSSLRERQMRKVGKVRVKSENG